MIKKINPITRKTLIRYVVIPLWMGLITALLLCVDSVIAPLILPEPELSHLPFGKQANFSWMAFVSWTFFFSCTLKERIKALPCIFIGFFAASMAIFLGIQLSGFMTVKIGNISLGFLLAAILISASAVALSNMRFLHLDNINGIFYGMAITYSQSAVGWDMSSLKLLAVILIYGTIGLICGWLSSFSWEKLLNDGGNQRNGPECKTS